ncbi:hypothetical protein EMIT0P253_30205 [Pseudomonas sp. IT-P253]
MPFFEFYWYGGKSWLDYFLRLILKIRSLAGEYPHTRCAHGVNVRNFMLASTGCSWSHETIRLRV